MDASSITEPLHRDLSGVVGAVSIYERTPTSKFAVCVDEGDGRDCCEVDVAAQRIFARVGATATSTMFPSFFAYYDPITVSMTFDGQLYCVVTQGTYADQVSLPAPRPMGAVRLSASDAVVRFRYVDLFGDAPVDPDTCPECDNHM